MNIYRFKKIFNSLISKKKSLKLLKIIDLLFKKNILNEELVLNFIKAFVIIFYLNPDYFNDYYKILNNIAFKMKIPINKDILKKLKQMKFSNQIYLSNFIIDKIIITTNTFIIENKDLLIENNFVIIYDILNTIFNLNL